MEAGLDELTRAAAGIQGAKSVQRDEQYEENQRAELLVGRQLHRDVDAGQERHVRDAGDVGRDEEPAALVAGFFREELEECHGAVRRPSPV